MVDGDGDGYGRRNKLRIVCWVAGEIVGVVEGGMCAMLVSSSCEG
jgi:hypothetical protein